MRNMKRANYLLIFLLLIVAATTQGNSDGGGHDNDAYNEVAVTSGCGRAGALLCDDDGRHLKVCTRSGVWSHVRDCGATRAVCAHGRCVSKRVMQAMGQAEAASVRDETYQCTASEKSCSADCTEITQCSTNHNWVVIGKCSAGTLCHQGKCVPEGDFTCGSSGIVMCGYETVGHFFPNMEDCSSYFVCSEEWEPAKIQFCEEGFYDPCSTSEDPCTLKTKSSCVNKKYEPCEIGKEGLDTYVWSNPSKYYTCMYDTEVRTVWKKCEVGYYDDTEGECVGKANVCSENDPTDPNTNTDTEPDPSQCSKGDKWPVQGNECQFNYCNSDGTAIVVKCDQNSKYIDGYKACVYSLGSCLRQ